MTPGRIIGWSIAAGFAAVAWVLVAVGVVFAWAVVQTLTR